MADALGSAALKAWDGFMLIKSRERAWAVVGRAAGGKGVVPVVERSLVEEMWS